MTWATINAALRDGDRGLPGGDSLVRLLARERGRRTHVAPPPFTVALILAWADAHRRRTGAWPHPHAGTIADAPGETWRAVSEKLRKGGRGLPGGSSIAKLLRAERGVSAGPRTRAGGKPRVEKA